MRKKENVVLIKIIHYHTNINFFPCQYFCFADYGFLWRIPFVYAGGVHQTFTNPISLGKVCFDSFLTIKRLTRKREVFIRLKIIPLHEERFV